MTDLQLYLAIGVPSFAVLLGILTNSALYLMLNGRITALEGRVNQGFDMIVGKIGDIDSRLSVLEDRLKR